MSDPGWRRRGRARPFGSRCHTATSGPARTRGEAARRSALVASGRLTVAGRWTGEDGSVATLYRSPGETVVRGERRKREPDASRRPNDEAHSVRGCRMGWASGYIDKLRRGETVSFRPRHSMSGRIESGQLCTVVPADPTTLAVGDMVLCKVPTAASISTSSGRSGGRRFQIGNNRGHVNGWVGVGSVLGRWGARRGVKDRLVVDPSDLPGSAELGKRR